MTRFIAWRLSQSGVLSGEVSSVIASSGTPRTSEKTDSSFRVDCIGWKISDAPRVSIVNPTREILRGLKVAEGAEQRRAAPFPGSARR